MLVKELLEKLNQIKNNNPDLNVDDMEIGPLFNNGQIMMTNDVFLVDEGAWIHNDINGHKCIAIDWHC